MTPAITVSGPAFKKGVCRTVVHHTRTWRCAKAEIVQRTGLEKEETSVISDRHLVLLNLKGNSERGEYTLDGRVSAFVARKPGAILFIPAGCHWCGWEVGASSAAYLSISIDPAFVSQLCSDMPAKMLPRLSPDLGFEDPIMMAAARGIGAEIRDRNPVSTMLVESFTATILAQLMRKERHVPVRQRGGLTSLNLSRLLEEIDGDLTGDLSLEHLANIVGFSIPHLCRAFRQTVGCPPHTFILRRRVERSKQLLRDTLLPLTEIALSCGFSSSSHFSNTFKREVGETPLDYRANWSLNQIS